MKIVNKGRFITFIVIVLGALGTGSWFLFFKGDKKTSSEVTTIKKNTESTKPTVITKPEVKNNSGKDTITVVAPVTKPVTKEDTKVVVPAKNTIPEVVTKPPVTKSPVKKPEVKKQPVTTKPPVKDSKKTPKKKKDERENLDIKF